MPTTRGTLPSTKPAKSSEKQPKRVLVNTLNDLEAREWISETVSVWTQRGLGKGHVDTRIEREHPAPFSFQDVGRLIRFFSKAGQTVLDPFAGVGSTLKAAALDQRRGIGIELNPRYADLARERMRCEVDAALLKRAPQEIHTGDCRAILSTLRPGSIDLVVTSPPYWNILQKRDHKVEQERIAHGLDTQYSDDPRDLGNISSYELFVDTLGSILGQCRNLLKPKGYMCIVVGDFRHKSRYYVFHADLIRRLENHGFVTKGLHILYQRHKRVFPYGYPTAFVPNLHHQFIVIVQREN
jgi:DNA modification methylase